ncbi:MAG: tetratricopeptide repeat protein [bacterium]|nr:tetratricopeptide repeat protein [Candidatus Limimorpha caballi]
MMRIPRPIRFMMMTLFLAMSFVVSYNIDAQVLIGGKDPTVRTNEQLAYEFYNKKDYEKAADLFEQLYKDTKKSQFFHSFIDCLLLTGNYEKAEDKLKPFLKSNPTAWKSRVDLAYVYAQNGDKDKADKYVAKIVKDVPENRNSIVEVANLLRRRNFTDAAIALFDKGAKSKNIQYNFYTEKAYTYNSILDFDNAIKYYLLDLQEDARHYDNVKNQFRVLLMYDMNGNVSDVMRMALLEKSQENPENEEFSQLLMWFSLQQKDYDLTLMQLKALDRRKGDYENDILNVCHIASDNQQFDIAIDGFEYVAEKSHQGVFYIEAKVGLLESRYKKAVAEGGRDKRFYEDISSEITKVFDEIGFYRDTKPLMTVQAHILAYELDRPDEAIELIDKALQLGFLPSDNAALKMELADIYLYKDEVWEATLLYSQVEKSMKNDPIAHEARFKNGQLRYFIGEFEWAQAALGILKAATSKLIANDAMTLSLTISDNLEYDTIALRRLAKADYYIYQHRYDLANQMLDSINAYNPNEVSMPNLLYRKAKMARATGDFAMADSLYHRVFEGYQDSYLADEALMEDAQLLENQLDRKADAMECYAKLFDYYTASVYVAQARKSYRRLRDDLK